jgi:hypothetical protein
MAADDPGYGTALTAQLSTASGQAGTESAMLRDYLRASVGDLSSALRTDQSIRQAAGEYARAWGGARLASRLDAAARTPAGASIDDDILFPAAVALIRSPGA